MYNTNDVVKIAVQTTFGVVEASFVVLCALNTHNSIYALLAQDKVVVAQCMVDNTWKFSEPIDLHKIEILPKVIGKTAKKNGDNSNAQQIADKF